MNSPAHKEETAMIDSYAVQHCEHVSQRSFETVVRRLRGRARHGAFAAEPGFMLTTIRREPGLDQRPQGEIRRIGKSANQAATDLRSKSDKQNQIGLQSTRGRQTVRANTGESASWAHDGQSPIAHINRR
jgi:hypothetical protein